jgi:hypothetical protein
MALHLLSARRLADKLAAGKVSPQEQASYLAISFLLWVLPGYFFVVPQHTFGAWSIPFGLWFYEALALGIVSVGGTFYCLKRCHVEPQRHFLVDFSCLYAPVSLTTLVVVYGLFHIYASLVPWLLRGMTFDMDSPFQGIYSPRSYDLLRYAAVVGTWFVIFVRIGSHLQRISNLRLDHNR